MYSIHVLEKIIGKKSHIKILRILIDNEKQEFCLEDIGKILDMSCGTLHPSLKELADTRIVTVRKVGRSIVYRINTHHILFKPVKIRQKYVCAKIYIKSDIPVLKQTVST